MKVLNAIFEKYPFFYILYKYNRQKPLYQQPAIFILILLFSLFFIRFQMNEFYIESLFGFFETIFYISLMMLFISINNNLIDIKNSTFLNQTLYTNQNSKQILVGLFFGLSFNIVIVIIFTLILDTYFLWLLTNSIYDIVINLLSKIFSFILIISLATLIANYMKFTILTTIGFIFGFIFISAREIGLMGVILGVKISLFHSKILPSDTDIGTMDIMYNKIILSSDPLNNITIIILLLIQFIFTYLFIFMLRKSYQYIKPKAITIKRSFIIFMTIYMLSFIYISIPQISYLSGIQIFNHLHSTEGDGELIIRQTFGSAEAYITTNDYTIYNSKQIVINNENLKKLNLTNKQKKFILTDLNSEKYNINSSELNSFIKELQDSKLFSFSQVVEIVRKMVNYKPIKKKNISSLLQHLKTMQSKLPQLKAQIKDIENKLEGYIYNSEKISFTFIWIYILSSIIFLNSSFQKIYTKKYKNINFKMIKHYSKFLLFVCFHLIIYYLMLFISIKDLIFIDAIDIMKDYLLIILYFPVILLGSYMIFIRDSEKFKKYIMYFHIFLFMILAISYNVESSKESTVLFVSILYVIFVSYLVIFYSYNFYKNK